MYFRIRTALILAGALLLSASCDRAQPKSAESTSRISFLHYFSGSLSGGVDDLVGAFNSANPGFELAATPLDHEAFKTSIVDTFKSGNPPDLYSYWAGAKTQAIVSWLEPIDDVWKDAGLDSVFPAALASSASIYGGSHYLLPLTQHLVGFFYNKADFAKAGVQPPRDWKSFLATCARLKAAGLVPLALGSDAKWPAQFWFDYILLRTAGPDFRQGLMEGKERWTDPRVLRSFSLWRDLVAGGYFNAKPNTIAWDGGAARMVSDGRAAMTLMGTWIMGTWSGMAPGFKGGKDYGFFAFPTIDEGVVATALGPVDGVVVPKQAKNIPGAMRVLRYLAGSVPQEAMSKGSGALAPSLAVPPSAYDEIQRQVRDLIASTPRWAFNYDLATPPEASDIGLSLFSEFLEFPDSFPVLLEGTESKMRSISAAGAGP